MFFCGGVFVFLKEEVATFAVALSCAEDERVVTPRDDSPSDLMETELFAGEGLKAQEDKAFGMPTTMLFTSLCHCAMLPNFGVFIICPFTHLPFLKTHLWSLRLKISDFEFWNPLELFYKHTVCPSRAIDS